MAAKCTQTVTAKTVSTCLPGELVEFIGIQDNSRISIGRCVDRISKGVMAFAIGDDAWFGTIEALDEARIVLYRAEGAFVLNRDEGELFEIVDERIDWPEQAGDEFNWPTELD